MDEELAAVERAQVLRASPEESEENQLAQIAPVVDPAAKQLTDGTTDDVDLDCSPDGQWVAFSTFSSDIGTIWKIEN